MYAYVYDIGSDQDQETFFFIQCQESNHYHPVMHRIKLILDARSLAASPLIDIVAPMISFRKINLRRLNFRLW